MTESERATYLMELIRVYMQRYQTLAKIQWTFNGLFWSGTLITVRYLSDFPQLSERLLFIYGIVLIVAYSLSAYLLTKSVDWDKAITKHFRKQLCALLALTDYATVDKPYFWRWLIVQILITLILVVGAICYLVILHER